MVADNLNTALPWLIPALLGVGYVFIPPILRMDKCLRRAKRDGL